MKSNFHKYLGCLVAAWTTLLLLACGPQETASDSASLTIFAAASTTNAVQDIAALYQAQTGTTIITSFASSSTLAKQIEQGAPAQFYISANPKWMDYLEQAGVLQANTRQDLLGNRLVLIAPRGSELDSIDIKPGFDLLAYLPNDARLAMGDPAHVPAGLYGQSALTQLGLWSAVQSRVAPMSDVRAALSIVERGEAPLGIVYATDAAMSDQVKVVGVFPAESHAPIVYPLAMVSESSSAASALFYDFLQGPEASAVFEKYGFSVSK
ncbi:molybdate ABC transporter substrate-binding protein [Coraliomargarita sp. W4R72]